MRLMVIAGLIFLWGMPSIGAAQNNAADVYPAEVIAVVSETDEMLPGTEIRSFEQQLEVRLTGGDLKGQRLPVFNNYVLLAAGDKVIVARGQGVDGAAQWYVQDVDRRGPVVFFALLFMGAVIALAGKTGARALISLGISFAIIFFVLNPLILAGLPPIAVVIGVAALILALVMYLTHGITAVTHAAFLGTVLTVALSGMLAWIAVAATRLSGFAADEAVYLNASTGGELDLAGLLLGAILIGALGLLDDIAVTQAATVAQLRHAAPHLTPRELYRRAMAVGREHIGALVNTLALAYAGVSLPLLLLFFQLDAPGWMMINQEVFATEIVRTAVGGIALVLAVPLATIFAIRFTAGLGPEKLATEAHAHHQH